MPGATMVLKRVRNNLRRWNEPSTSSKHPCSLFPQYSASTTSLNSTLFTSAPRDSVISPYAVRAPLSPQADMTPITIIAGPAHTPVVMAFPRALLEHNSQTFRKLLQAEGMLDETTICMPEGLEPTAVKAGLKIICSRTGGGWELNTKAPRVSSNSSSAASSVRAPRRNIASNSASRNSSLTASSQASMSSRNSDDEREDSIWWIKLFEVGSYVESEAVQNIAISGYRRCRRSLGCSRMWPEIDYMTLRSLWDSKLGEFVVALMAFEARSEDSIPEWVLVLLEEAPEKVVGLVEKKWKEVRKVESTTLMMDCEDRINPCVAMGCLWHTHKETKSCVEEGEKEKWLEAVDRLVKTPRGPRAIKLEKVRSL